ncbi:MAG: hypothetical protein WC637_04575 [Victivallales bacterium]|jgi:hypothetical protein
MKRELSSENSVLLAMIIEDLCMEGKSRDESWIIQQQNPDLRPLVALFIVKEFQYPISNK